MFRDPVATIVFAQSHKMRDAKLFIDHAKVSDKERILTMCQGIYNGFDYLEHIFDCWIRDPISKRHNIVLKLKTTDKIIGFQSFCIQNDGKMALQQALRISDDEQGKGYGTKFNQMVDEYLKVTFGKIILLKVLYSASASKNALERHELIFGHPCTILHACSEQLLNLQRQLTMDVRDFNPLQLEQDKFLTMLQNSHFPLCLTNDFLHVDWVIYHKNDLQLLLTMQKTKHCILADSNCVSIMAFPFNVPAGQRTAIGIYCPENVKMETVILHLKKQLLTLIENGLKGKLSLTVTSNSDKIGEDIVDYLENMSSSSWDVSYKHSAILVVSKEL